MDETCFSKHDLQILFLSNQTGLKSPRKTMSSSESLLPISTSTTTSSSESLLPISTSTTSSSPLSNTDWITEASKSSPRQGTGIQNKSFGSTDKNEGDSGLSTLTNADVEGHGNVFGRGEIAIGTADDVASEVIGKRDVTEDGEQETTQVGDIGIADTVVIGGHNAALVNIGEQDATEEGDTGKISDESQDRLKNDSHLALSERIVSSVKGPFTLLSNSDVTFRDEHGTGSSSVFGTSSMLVLASDVSVNTKVSLQTAGITSVFEPPVISTIWPDGNRTEKDRLISSFADGLIMTDEAAILNERLKKNKENYKVLCSNSKFKNLKSAFLIISLNFYIFHIDSLKSELIWNSDNHFFTFNDVPNCTDKFFGCTV